MKIPRVPFYYALCEPFTVNRFVGTCGPVYCSPDNCDQEKTIACIAIIGWCCVYVLVNCYQMKNVCITINNGGIHVLVIILLLIMMAIVIGLKTSAYQFPFCAVLCVYSIIVIGLKVILA